MPDKSLNMVHTSIKLLFATIILCLLIVTVNAEAKVYIWTDQNKMTHYCNDLDDVPKKYREECRIIESKASSRRASSRRTSKSNSGHINTAIKNLRTRSNALNKEMFKLRRKGVRHNSTQYIKLRKEYMDIQNKIRQLYSQKSKNSKMKKR
jgi:hypothetical protein